MILNFPIKGEKSTITRPIVFKVMNDLKEYLGMSIFSHSPIVYLDEEGVRKERGTSVHSDGREGLNLENNEQMQVQVQEETFAQTEFMYQEFQQEFKPIFLEPVTGTHITPFYANMEMKFNISYRAQSRPVAQAWLNSIRSSLRRYGNAFPHNLEYHYQIDDKAMIALSEIYKLIANQVKVENISDWMQKHFINRFGTTSDSAGLNKIFTVSETQQQVFGYFDFEGMIEPGERVDGGGGWIVSFDYIIRYMKPTDLSLHYPRVIYNQVVPDILMGNIDNYNNTIGPPDVKQPSDTEHTYLTQSQFNLLKHSALVDMESWSWYNGIVIPRWNEFAPSQSGTIRGTSRLVDILVLFDKDDKPGTELLDLNNQDLFDIYPALKDFIIKEGNYTLYTGKSIFQLLLYKNDRMMDRREDGALYFEKGKIYLNKEIEIGATYNLRLAIYYDWRFVDTDAINRLMKEEDLYKKIVDYCRGDRGPNDNSDEWGRDRYGKNNMKTVQTFYTVNYRNKDDFIRTTKRSIRT